MDRPAGGPPGFEPEADAIPAFRRALDREGPVPTRARVAQGMGGLPDVFKDFAVRTFLLLYYNQVLGLPAFYVSLALAFALVVAGIILASFRRPLDKAVRG